MAAMRARSAAADPKASTPAAMVMASSDPQVLERIPTLVVASPEDIERLPHSQNSKVGNWALKFIRDHHEYNGTPLVRGIELTHMQQLNIPMIIDGKGPDYTFDENHTTTFSWRLMLRAMPPRDRELILGTGEGAGVHRITCQWLPGSYDHKRQAIARRLGRPFPDDSPVPIWDFVVWRPAGQVVRFHPSKTSAKVEISLMETPPPSVPPVAGKGRSDGPGTFKSYKKASYTLSSSSRGGDSRSHGRGEAAGGASRSHGDCEAVASREITAWPPGCTSLQEFKDQDAAKSACPSRATPRHGEIGPPPNRPVPRDDALSLIHI